MSVILTFASKWVRWYGVLRYAKEFSFVDSRAMACGSPAAGFAGRLLRDQLHTANESREINAALL